MLKLLAIGVLILLLLIPAFLISDLIRERRNLRDDAQAEVAAKFGGEQTFGGPVISVPYAYEVTTGQNEDGPITSVRTGYAHFLPDDINIQAELVPEERYRGIFVVVLYNTRFSVRGSFDRFNVDALDVPDYALRWDDALFTIGIADMKGVDASITARVGGRDYEMGPGTITNEVFQSGASSPIAIAGAEDLLNFEFDVVLNGSSGLYFRPFGKTTSVELVSTWPDPSFDGSFLPQGSEVSQEGFRATWEVLQLNRNYPQQGTGAFVPPAGGETYYDDLGYRGANFSSGDRFGVRLLLPVDEYKKIYRSTEYAILFVIITFLTFFFIEVLNRQRVHPIQYILIGAAILLFYVLLLSISEHQYFDFAYWISALAITTLITGYSYAILRHRKLTLLVGGVLLILYVFFYSLLQLQDFALLIGSLGLLLILATIMYLTRNVDWYRLGEE